MSRLQAAAGLLIYGIIATLAAGWLILAIQHSAETHGHEPSPYEVEAELSEHLP